MLQQPNNVINTGSYHEAGIKSQGLDPRTASAALCIAAFKFMLPDYSIALTKAGGTIYLTYPNPSQVNEIAGMLVFGDSYTNVSIVTLPEVAAALNRYALMLDQKEPREPSYMSILTAMQTNARQFPTATH